MFTKPLTSYKIINIHFDKIRVFSPIIRFQVFHQHVMFTP